MNLATPQLHSYLSRPSHHHQHHSQQEQEPGSAVRSRSEELSAATSEALPPDSSLLRTPASAPKLFRTATAVLYKDARSRSRLNLEQLSLAGEIHNLFRIMQSGRWATVVPDKLLHAIWRNVPQFHTFVQQDAQEFLSFFVDRLHEELSSRSVVSSLWERGFPKSLPRFTLLLSYLHPSVCSGAVNCSSPRPRNVS